MQMHQADLMDGTHDGAKHDILRVLGNESEADQNLTIKLGWGSACTQGSSTRLDPSAERVDVMLISRRSRNP